MDISAALPTFVVTLREGVEAALVVGIVLAYLKKAEQTRLNRWVYAGIAAGIMASMLVGVLFNGVLLALETSDRPYASWIWRHCHSTAQLDADLDDAASPIDESRGRRRNDRRAAPIYRHRLGGIWVNYDRSATRGI
jgi:hypothetical protein